MTHPSDDPLSDPIRVLQQSTDTCQQLARQVVQACEADSPTFLAQLNQLRSQLQNHERRWNEWTNSRDSQPTANISPGTQSQVDQLIHSVTSLMETLNQLERKLESRRDAIAPRIGRLREETRGRSEYLRVIQ